MAGEEATAVTETAPVNPPVGVMVVVKGAGAVPEGIERAAGRTARLKSPAGGAATRV